MQARLDASDLHNSTASQRSRSEETETQAEDRLRTAAPNKEDFLLSCLFMAD